MSSKTANRKLKDKASDIIGFFRENRPDFLMSIVMVVAIIVFIALSIMRLNPAPHDEITASVFSDALENGRVTSVSYDISANAITGEWMSEDGSGLSEYSAPYSAAGREKLEEQLASYPEVSYQVVNTYTGTLTPQQSFCVIIALFMVFTLFVRHKIRVEASETSIGSMPLVPPGSAAGTRRKPKATIGEAEIPDVHFSDIAGVDESLAEVREICDFLKYPEKFANLGAKVPKGVLMAGPPGCGKTYMAKALACESGSKFFTMSGSDFMEMFVGVGASRVRNLFAAAKENAPAIIFIDEIDAIGRTRSNDASGGSGESDRTLNQLLVEMDGFGGSDNVIVVGATNRIDTLDPALLRPGRFDRHIMVDRPDKSGREEILAIHAKNKPLDETVDLGHYATITAGMSGAELANLMNEAAIFAAREDKTSIGNPEMNAAFERIVAGAEKKTRTLSDFEKRTTAYHEAGHAIVGHKLEGADKVSKISIISRGQALGYTLTLPEEDHFLHTRSHLKDKLAMMLGGLVAEEMINGNDISTGPSNDLERATKMATSMATRFGMCDELGRRAFVSENNGPAFNKPYSEEKGREIDAAVDALMQEAHDTAANLLAEHQDVLEQLANVLIDKEVVEGDEMEDLLDGCWKGVDAYDAAGRAVLASSSETLGESASIDVTSSKGCIV